LLAWRFSEFICRVTSSKMSFTRFRLVLASSRRASARRFFVLNFVMPSRFFDDGAAIRRTAAQNLADASLLDERVGLRPEARAHEQFLDVAQAAEFSIQQIFAVAAAEQAARDGNFSGVVLLLIEFAAADFQNHLRPQHCHCAAVLAG
jgi:hypothetical protein